MDQYRDLSSKSREAESEGSLLTDESRDVFFKHKASKSKSKPKRKTKKLKMPIQPPLWLIEEGEEQEELSTPLPRPTFFNQPGERLEDIYAGVESLPGHFS
jgi:hypothetical protein